MPEDSHAAEAPHHPEMATAVVLFSHGSLLCGSHRVLDEHARRLQSTGRFVAVEPGYLNYSAPSVEDAITKCVKAGAGRVLVVPYFLVAGKFVTEDLPTRVRQAEARHPSVEIILGGAIEAAPSMVDAIMQAAENLADLDAWQHNAIREAQDQCENRSDCPLYGSALCRAGKDTP